MTSSPLRTKLRAPLVACWAALFCAHVAQRTAGQASAYRRPWIPAFAGKRGGAMRSELMRAGTAESRTVTVELETVDVRGICSRSA